MRNFFSPRSSLSSTFCFSSCRLPTMSWPSTSTTTISPSFLIEKLMSYSPGSSSAGLVPCHRRARGLVGRCRLQRGDGSHIDNVVNYRAAREIVARPSQPLHDRPDGGRPSHALHQLVRDVPGIQRRKHEHVRPSGHGAVRSFPGSHV